MSISAAAATARENARQTDGKFGSFTLDDAGVEADLDMDLSWLEEETDGDFGADPTEASHDETAELRRAAEHVSRWLEEHSHTIGWDDDCVDERGSRFGPGGFQSLERLSNAPMRPDTAEAERRVMALGAEVSRRAEQLAGVDLQAEREAHAERVRAAKEGMKEIEQRRKELDAECAAVGLSAECSIYLGQLTAGHRGRFTDRLREQLQGVRPGMVEDIERFAADRRAAAKRVNLTCSGRDPQTIAVLSKLSTGYAQALSEVRPLGGTPVLHAKTTKPAREAFTEAVSVYPADWIIASNDDPKQMVGKISKKRAHYSHHNVEKTKKRVRSGYDHRAPLQDVAAMNAHSELVSYELVDSTPDAEGKVLYRASYWQRPLYSDPAVPPKGRGWEGHTYIDRSGHEKFIWRQPSTRMQTVSSEIAPEILTNKRENPLEGRSETFEVAVHESAHRFEATVPGITDLERAFLDRRCRAEDGTLRRLQTIAPGEYARDGMFVNRYVGREYANGGREVLSVGTQALFGGRYGGLVGMNEAAVVDTDHRDFVLGIMAAVGRRD